MPAPILSYAFAKQHGVIIEDNDDTSHTIIHQPTIELATIEELQRTLNKPLQFKAVSHEQFQRLLAQTYSASSDSAAAMAAGIEDELNLDELVEQIPATADLLDTQNDAPVIRLLNALFSQAIKQKASDIHIEPFANNVNIRFRIDGVLQDILSLPNKLAPLLTSRVKVMAKLDIAEKRLPQDGRIALRSGGHPIDVRVSTIPSSHGERVVMRILDQQSAQLALDLLGMRDAIYQQVETLIKQPHGIILVTGPTGSGKTTTLYAMLTELNQSTRNILTIEDPIEYDLPGIGQTQVNTKVDMTFARGLRAILRQDPDVVMVGEIRDVETAEISVQASLTGHLVLSTLHTNTALGAIARLQDMGVEAFLLSSSLLGVIAQRLVRRLCPQCKHARTATMAECEQLGCAPATTIYDANGCETCAQSGYVGRCGIYEVITLDSHLQQLIHDGAGEQRLTDYARQHYASLRADGYQRVIDGTTSLAEVIRVTSL